MSAETKTETPLGIVYTTFGKPDLDRELDSQPCRPFNSNPGSVLRYRVTVEVIPEPVDVLRARALSLLNGAKYNIHHSDAWERMFLEYGLVEIPTAYDKPRAGRLATAEEWAEMRDKAQKHAQARRDREQREKDRKKNQRKAAAERRKARAAAAKEAT